MIAFDSNVLIYTMGCDSPFQKEAAEVFRQIAVEGGSCSTLVITESLYGSIVSVDQIPILSSPHITIVPVTQKVAEKAGQLKVAHGLKNIDAIHVASALYSGASLFITNDSQLRSKTIDGITIRGL